jgi:hypothetical protein
MSAATVQQLRKPIEAVHASGPFFEVIDSEELAKRWKVPSSWVREGCRSRATDQIPHVKLGRYIRFSWGSPELTAWWNRRQVGK